MMESQSETMTNVLSDEELVNRYLKRIHLDPNEIRKAPVDVKLLELLQDHHVMHIPFENLDQHDHPSVGSRFPETARQWTDDGHSILVDPRLSILKLIRNEKDLRGGFCFELNLPFAWLLRQLGFDVQVRLSQVCFGDNPAKPGTLVFTLPAHSLSLVHLGDKYYIADVGFGDFARCTLSLPADVDPTQYFDATHDSEGAGSAFKSEKESDFLTIGDQHVRAITPAITDKVGDQWRIAVCTAPFPEHDAIRREMPFFVLRYRRLRFSMEEEWLGMKEAEALKWTIAYRFSAKPYDPATSDAFRQAMCFVITDSNSPFNQKRIVMKATENGHITLSERRFKTIEGNRVAEVPVQDNAQWRELLHDKFGISLAPCSTRNDLSARPM